MRAGTLRAFLAGLAALAVLASFPGVFPGARQGTARAASTCPAGAPPGPGDFSSPQTLPTPEITRVASRLKGTDVRASIRAAMVHIVEELAYDSGLNTEQFDRTAGDMFRRSTLGGCSEFALALLALLRAMDVPSRLVLTANTAWMDAYRKNPFAIPNGHSMVEAWDGQQWLLVDPTGLTVYERHDPCHPCLPGGEVFMARGGDFWALGIRGVEDASGMLTAMAYAGRPACDRPTSLAAFTATVDFVRAFLNQAGIFLKNGKHNMAARLSRKALELEPDNRKAMRLRGEALLGMGDCVRAAEVFDRLLEPSPGDPEVQALRKKARDCRPLP